MNKQIASIMKRTLFGTMLSMVGLPVVTWASTDVEKVFDQAGEYTVYIKTSIAIPFIEDTAESWAGTGFVVDSKRRWIMTNAHVSGHSPATISVEFKNGIRVAAWPVYIDARLDLAILEYAASDEEISQGQAELECKDVPSTGHPVGAFGHPWGIKFTGTRGIISGQTPRFGGPWLQTDAPVNHGNSGGPLISLETGRVVGINTAKVGDKEAQDTNFAVIGVQACRVFRLLTENRQTQPPQLGVTFYELDGDPTLIVAHTRQNASFASGDVILAVDGAAIDPANEGELLHQLRGKGGTAEFTVKRKGETVLLRPPLSPMESPLERSGVLVAGVFFAPSTFRDYQRLAKPTPLEVHFVQPGSEGEAAQIAEFDHLLAINGEPISNLDELRTSLAATESGDPLILSLLRYEADTDEYLQDVLAIVPNGPIEEIRFE